MIAPRYRRRDSQTQQHYRFRATLYEIANREHASEDRLLHSFDELLMFARAVSKFDPCFAVRQLTEALPRYANGFEQHFPGLFGEAGMLRLENPARNVLHHIRQSIERGESPKIPECAPNIPALAQLLEEDARLS